MASLTWWIWVWVNSGNWWWTGRPGVPVHGVSKSRTRLSDWTDSMYHFSTRAAEASTVTRHFSVHFSLYAVLLMTYYLLFILYFRLGKWWLDKKQIRVIFLHKFKMGCKAAETTHNINSAFGPGTAYEQTVHWWFKKFCKGHRSLKDEGLKGWPSEADYDQLRGSVKLIQLQIYKKLQRKQPQPFYSHSAFEPN